MCKEKMAQEDKTRCADYLLQMLEKYGAELLSEQHECMEKTT